MDEPDAEQAEPDRPRRRRHSAAASGSRSGGERALHHSGPISEGVRIAAVEAAVAAGLAPSTTRTPEPPRSGTPEEAPTAYVLPDWTDPPTGQVPRVLLDQPGLADEAGWASAPTRRGPSWREGGRDWDEEVDLSFLGEGLSDPAGGAGAEGIDENEEHPFGIAFEELVSGGTPAVEPEHADGVDDHAWNQLISQPHDGDDPLGLDVAPRRRHAAGRSWRRQRPPAPSGQAPAPSGRRPRRVPVEPRRRSGRAVARRLVTGVAAAAVVSACLLGGALPALVLVSVVIALAAGEVLGALRRAGYRPAAPVVLLAAPALTVAAYLRGVGALPAVLAAALGLCWCWFLPARRRGLTADLGVSVLVLTWVGLLGGFAGALLAPARFPHGDGVALLGAVLLLAVGNDVGAFAAGSRLGRHPLAPRVSPHKTWEGLLGGTAVTIALGFAAAELGPLSRTPALTLAALVCLLAPLGDLAESLVKRDLGLKDMGDLLPAHGGLLDRIDSLLLVLPAAYYLALGFGLR